jgi:hypothetical protein
MKTHKNIKTKLIKHENDNNENQSPNSVLQNKYASISMLHFNTKSNSSLISHAPSSVKNKFKMSSSGFQSSFRQNETIKKFIATNSKKELRYTSLLKENHSHATIADPASQLDKNNKTIDVIKTEPNLLYSPNITENTNEFINNEAQSYRLEKNKININPFNYLKANKDRVKISHKSFGIIEAYSAITTEGIIR